MGCVETFVMRLPNDYNQAARDALAHRPRNACGSHRSLAVIPPLANGGTTARLRGVSGGASPSSAIRAAVGRKCLEIKPRPEKVCTTTPQLASLPEAVIRGGGCSGRVSFN